MGFGPPGDFLCATIGLLFKDQYDYCAKTIDTLRRLLIEFYRIKTEKEAVMYQMILGPLDGSNVSECALNHIKAVAMGCQVPEVSLITVVGEPPVEFMESSSRAQTEAMAEQHRKELTKARQLATEYLAEVSSRLKKDGMSVKTEVITCGITKNAADCILDYAKDHKSDLIVMSTHGRRGLSRWAFGSVAEKVVRASPVPVLTVTPSGCRVWPMP